MYTSPFLETDGLKMTLWAQKVSGAFEKWVPVPEVLRVVVIIIQV